MEIPQGAVPESWDCIDCGFNTAPGLMSRKQLEASFSVLSLNRSPQQTIDTDSEMYMVKKTIWQAAGMGDFDGCLCIGCLEKRLGRKLKPRDFMRDHVFNSFPGTDRLLSRRGDY